MSHSRTLYIPFDHLHRDYGIIRDARKSSDVILFVESERMRTGRNWHPERLFFLISSARHFAKDLRDEGFTVEYVKAPTTEEGILQARKRHPKSSLHASRQSSFRLQATLEDLGCEFIENDFFLTPRDVFEEWASSQKNYLMENFYREQRRRLNILMDNGKPTGGAWNFDKENRLPPPKNYKWLEYKGFTRDEIDQEVAQELAFEASPTWATTCAAALHQLRHFISQHFAHFGPYEDAMVLDSWSLHHSVISPYINNGLLHPQEVVDAAEKRAWVHHIPRLMVLGNLALITGTNPQQFLEWMRERFVDASEWVMVPNVIGMGVHADGGQMMSKPYAAGGAYISRMSEYCRGCSYNPKLRVGDDACPFTTLYWDFLDRNKELFAKNHRMFQQINGLKRLSDLPELRERAKEVLAGLDNGEI